MANDGHPLTVHGAIALQVSHHFGRRPRPDPDGPPAAALARHAGLLCKPRMETVVHRIHIRPVELQVAIVGGDHAVPPGQDELYGPPRRISPQALFLSLASRATGLLGLTWEDSWLGRADETQYRY